MLKITLLRNLWLFLSGRKNPAQAEGLRREERLGVIDAVP